eukprot:403339213
MRQSSLIHVNSCKNNSNFINIQEPQLNSNQNSISNLIKLNSIQTIDPQELKEREREKKLARFKKNKKEQETIEQSDNSYFPMTSIEQKQYDTLRVLEQLKQRNCKDNIKKYKEELLQLKYLTNPFTSTISHSTMESKINKLISNHTNNSQSNANSLQQQEQRNEVKYQKLREYLRLYKQRLYLVPKHQIMEEDKDMHGLDYTSYKALQGSGMNILEVVNKHRQQSEELYANIGINVDRLPNGLDTIGEEKSKVYQKQIHRISSKQIITDKKLDKQLSSKNKSFLTDQSINGMIAFSGQSFGNVRSNLSLDRIDNDDIMKVADEIQRQYYQQDKQKKLAIAASKKSLNRSVESGAFKKKKSSTAQVKIRNVNQTRSVIDDQQSPSIRLNKNLHSVNQSAEYSYIMNKITKKPQNQDWSRNRNMVNSNDYDMQNYLTNQSMSIHCKGSNNSFEVSKLMEINKSCDKINFENKKLNKKYRQVNRDLRNDLNYCKTILRTSQDFNPLDQDMHSSNIESQQFEIKIQN